MNAALESMRTLARGFSGRPVVVTALVIAVGCALAPGRVTAQAKSTQDGVFSVDQAASGRATFEAVCAQCHTPDQFGSAFIQSWAGATVGDMYDLISALMPEDQPGSLEPAQYVAVLSYIFQMNGLPTGPTALGEQRTILGGIRIEN